jgi:AcrR family transcriptional regulator
MQKKAKGSVYYYFTSKEILFIEVVKADLHLMQKELENVLKLDTNQQNQLIHYIKCRFHLLPELKNYFQALKMNTFEESSFLNAIFDDFRLYEKKTIAKLLSNIKDNSTSFQNNIELLTETIYLLINSLELQIKENKSIPERTNILENSAVLLLQGANFNLKNQ